MWLLGGPGCVEARVRTHALDGATGCAGCPGLRHDRRRNNFLARTLPANVTRARCVSATAMKRILVSLCLVLCSWPANGRIRAVPHSGSLPTPKSVLWIGAHPDDEAVAAPLLALWCREQHARCAFLVLTRGEAGTCLRPDGCLPDVATIRSSEVGAASQYFGADSILLTLPDGGGSVPPGWQFNGAPSQTIETISKYIQAVGPELILTFDPRHGTTCHPDHRAVGSLVLEAVKVLPNSLQVYLLESRVTYVSDPFAVHFGTAQANAERFDANMALVFTRGPAWNAVLDDMRRHQSQFDLRWLSAVENVPPSERSVFLAPAALALQQPTERCQ